MNVYISLVDNPLPYEDYIMIRPQNPFALENEGIDNGELDSLYVDGILDRVGFQGIEQAIGYFAAKVKIGGKLILKGVDFIQISRNFNYGTVKLETVNQYLAGRTILDHGYIKYCLNKLNLKIERQLFIENYFVFEVIRNG